MNKTMICKNSFSTERPPSPLQDSNRTEARDEDEIKKKHQPAHVPGHNTRIEQANTRTEQAETRTKQAEARTEQAEMRTEQAEARSEQAILASEFNYRRLFEAAKEGILILEADTGRISDVNPFLTELLDFSHD